MELFGVKEKFNLSKVNYYIKDTNVVNAYALKNVRGQYVILTTGLIKQMSTDSKTTDEFERKIKAIVAHEFSHLLHNDYAPYMLYSSGLKALTFLENILTIIYNFALSIPFIGSLISIIFIPIKMITNLVIKFILNPLELLIKMYLSRKNEFRADKNAAQTMGWENTFIALETFYENYKEGFLDTHPVPYKRLVNIYKQKKVTKKVSRSFFVYLINTLWLTIYIFLIMYLLNSFHIFKNMPLLKDTIPTFITEFYSFINSNIVLFASKSREFYFNEIKFFIELNYIKIETFYNKYLNLNVEQILLYGTVISIALLFLYLLVYRIRLNIIKKCSNSVENTLLDNYLFHAININNKKMFLSLVKAGANTNSKLNGMSLLDFASHNNKKFMGLLKKIK
ncbi:MAG: M48 family metalloprotease [Helicobacteraceae bacterium]|nr:M48 family metalloprotease [Helicobacteraceae bacterium]